MNTFLVLAFTYIICNLAKTTKEAALVHRLLNGILCEYIKQSLWLSGALSCNWEEEENLEALFTIRSFLSQENYESLYCCFEFQTIVTCVTEEAVRPAIGKSGE